MAASLKPQDVLVALKLASHESRWTYASLAGELCMSPSAVHDSVSRLIGARIFSPVTNRVARRSLLEFLLHGVPYAFPAEAGVRTRGMPTAWGAAPLADRILQDETSGAVWPSPGGLAWGQEITPLYRSAPRAATRDAKLYELLALVDAVRAGRARERKMAADELAKRLAA